MANTDRGFCGISECGRTYQASAKSLTEPEDTGVEQSAAFIQELDSEGSSSVFNDKATNPGVKAGKDDEEHTKEDDLGYFRKIHLIFDSSDANKVGTSFQNLLCRWLMTLASGREHRLGSTVVGPARPTDTVPHTSLAQRRSTLA
jgi:hypothetical protein